MRNSTLATVLGATLLVCSSGAALADGGAYTASKHVEPLPGGHFLCDVAFDVNQTEVTYEGSVELDHAVDAMKTDEDALIVLDSHTDATGSQRLNTAVAWRRAEAVKDGLVARGIDPDRVVLAVYGENTAQGRIGRADRRVDLWMTYTVSVKDIVARTLAKGEAVAWTRPLTQDQIEHKPRLTATRTPTRATRTPSRTAAR